MAGRPVPDVRLPPPMPLEAWYPPRGLTWPPPVVEPLPAEDLAGGVTPAELRRRIAEGLRAENFRNLNNGNNQAPGAKQMMIREMAALSRSAEDLAALPAQAARPALQRLLAAPYPFAQYLALRGLGEGCLPITGSGLSRPGRGCYFTGVWPLQPSRSLQSLPTRHPPLTSLPARRFHDAKSLFC